MLLVQHDAGILVEVWGRGWGGGEEGRETDRGVSVGRGPIKAVHGARVTRVPLMIMIVAPRERKREAR